MAAAPCGHAVSPGGVIMHVLETAFAAIQSAVRGVEVAASNLANVNTDGYRARRYDAATGTVGPRHAEGASEPSERSPSDVDVAEEVIDMTRYERGAEANAAVVGVADRMTGQLLDIFG